MKKQKLKEWIEIVIGEGSIKCRKCYHSREGEPFALFHLPTIQGDKVNDVLCWHCCRGAESTFLIQQKWPLAFERVDHECSWRLYWSPGVKALVGENDKT